MAEIKLGQKVKDAISGFTGVATGRCIYLYGCKRILISPNKTDKDGKVIEGQWFDEEQVVQMPGKTFKKNKEIPPAGPQNDPPSR